MCGRIVRVFDAKLGKWVTKSDAAWEDDDDVAPVMKRSRYNITPTNRLPIMLGGVSPHLEIARWGFPLPPSGKTVFNTRIDRAAESPMWRGLLGKTHCIIPATGFYEWDHVGGTKEPHYLHRADGEPMFMGGLFGKRDVKGESKLCVSVLTCAPDAVAGRFHDRMPVIFDESEADAWLHPESQPLEKLLDLCRTREGILTEHPVGPGVNDTDLDEPSLIEPAAPKKGRQMTLG